MKHPIKMVLLVLILTVVLSGCGRSPSKDIIGTWEFISSGETLGYVEISEGIIQGRVEIDDEPEKMAYRLIDLEEGRFMIEAAESYVGPYEPLLEGTFDGKDRILVDEESAIDGVSVELIRIKNLDQAIKKEKDQQEESIAEKEEDLEEDEQQEENEAEELAALEKEEEEKKQAQIAEEKLEKEKLDREKKDRERQEWEEKKKADDAIAKENAQQSQRSNLEATYLDRVNALDDKIKTEIETHYPGSQDLPYGFVGSYYSDWDDLLNEMWKTLSNTLPANEFEKLKSAQIEWIKMKERNFAEYSDQTASSRAMGMDYLANETKERVHYLLNNY